MRWLLRGRLASPGLHPDSEHALSSARVLPHPTPPRVQVFALMEALQEYPYVTHLDLSYNHLDDAALATVVRLLKYRCEGPHPPQHAVQAAKRVCSCRERVQPIATAHCSRLLTTQTHPARWRKHARCC